MLTDEPDNIPTGKNYDAWRTPQYTAESFAALPQEQQLRHLAILGHLAPNTHNTQPWKFHVHPIKMSITVFLDRVSVLPASDVIGRQTMISLGCAIQQICIGAEALGYTPLVSYLPIEKNQIKPPRSEIDKYCVPVATIQIIKSPAKNYDLYPAIFNRKVMRADYDPEQPVSTDIIIRLEQIAATHHVHLHPITDPVRKTAIAEFQGQADGFVINSKKFSRELGDWLLPTDTTSTVGMPGVGFGLKPDQAARLHRALSGQEPLQPEDGLRFALAGKRGMEKSPLICFLTTEKDETSDWLNTGRALDHMLLTLHAHGLCIAVHAGIVEVTLVNRLFAATLGTTRRIMAVFRTGYLKNAEDLKRPHAPRRPVEEIFLEQLP